MNMITGYIDPTDGEIIVNGVDVAKKPRKAKKLSLIHISEPTRRSYI